MIVCATHKSGELCRGSKGEGAIVCFIMKKEKKRKEKGMNERG